MDRRVVVITGGSKGIGRAVAIRFAKEGDTIVICHNDKDDSDSEETLRILAEYGVEAASKKVDVSDFEQVDRFFKDIIFKYNRVDVLINNAGITGDSLFMRMDETLWDRVISVNLKGAFNCTKAVIRGMIKQRRGWIVNISSLSGVVGNTGQANYSASKAALLGLTKTLARELAVRGIRVNAVAPGLIDTEMTASVPEKIKEQFLSQIPLQRMGRPEEVAEVVWWLCSEGASYITGQTIHVNGGMYMP
ncbi:MAG TPA: 3-oxoacyl-[acyl-carrier-protein] reductase [Desulfobacteraceae bacterium]|nr:3-oxoacyl-[acyl-carrier-protein] reductase [Desulfobacteraceae bacterium]